VQDDSSLASTDDLVRINGLDEGRPGELVRRALGRGACAGPAQREDPTGATIAIEVAAAAGVPEDDATEPRSTSAAASHVDSGISDGRNRWLREHRS
jgi:hypothetical protein